MDTEGAFADHRGMDVAYISALSALAGSVIGGLASGLTTWLSQRAQVRAGRFAHDRSLREELYRDFIVTASKMYADAVMNDTPQVQELIALYAMISRMRMVSSSQLVACAERITSSTIDAYFAPNKTIAEMHDLIKSGAMDPLRVFSELARDELRTLPLI